MKLSEIKERESAVIEQISVKERERRRLSRLGAVVGGEVTVIRKGLKGDPVEIEVLGSRLAIRKALAQMIAVKKI